MKRILCSDWLPKRTRWAFFSRSISSQISSQGRFMFRFISRKHVRHVQYLDRCPRAGPGHSYQLLHTMVDCGCL